MDDPFDPYANMRRLMLGTYLPRFTEIAPVTEQEVRHAIDGLDYRRAAEMFHENSVRAELSQQLQAALKPIIDARRRAAAEAKQARQMSIARAITRVDWAPAAS